MPSDSDYNSPVDEPPGKDGHQGEGSDPQHPVPEYPPGANPPGTNPPIDPPVDPASVPVPGSIPGVIVGGDTSPAPPTAPPEVIDVPHLAQEDTYLLCTMGNWTGEPTAYAYRFMLNGTDVSGEGDSYLIQAEDVGALATCVVTATNALGSTEAPPSNEVTIA